MEKIVYPGLAAAITGLLAGLLSWAVGWDGMPIGLGVALVAWLFRPGALPSLPSIQLPQVSEKTVKVHIISSDGMIGDYIQFGVTVEKLRKFATGMSRGNRLDCRTWTGRGALFSQSEFARLRSELINRGLARWTSDRDPRGGCVLTSRGHATMKGLAGLPQEAPPLPEISKTAYPKQTHTGTQQIIKY